MYFLKGTNRTHTHMPCLNRWTRDFITLGSCMRYIFRSMHELSKWRHGCFLLNAVRRAQGLPFIGPRNRRAFSCGRRWRRCGPSALA